MFAFAAFVFGAVGQELWRGVRARRAMSRDSVPAALRRARAAQPAPLRRLHRARRHRGAVRRRGGLVGVPVSSGSSSCGPARPSGSTATRSPTSARPRGSWRRATAGSSGSTSARGCRCGGRRPGARRSTPTSPTSRARTRASARSRASSRARRRPRSRSAPACGATSGPPSRPDIGRLLPRIEQGDKVFADATELSEHDRGAFLGEALRGLSRSYVDSPPPATFRLIASPLVTWIWLGGADRVRGRRDRALARGRPRAAPGDGGRAGPRGARARARVAAAWRCCWCSSWWRSPCSRSARRCGRRAGPGATRPARAERADLEAARDAKYAEIRDAEMDYRTGKLSEADWRATRPPAAPRGGRAAAPPRRRRRHR